MEENAINCRTERNKSAKLIIKFLVLNSRTATVRVAYMKGGRIHIYVLLLVIKLSTGSPEKSEMEAGCSVDWELT